MRLARRANPLAAVGAVAMALALGAGFGSCGDEPADPLWLMALCFGVPFVVVGGLGLWGFTRRIAEARVVPVQPIETFAPRYRRGLLLLRLRDPHFDEAAFLARAREAWVTLLEARTRHDLGPARVCVSDGVHERLALQVRAEVARRRRTELERVEIEDMRLVEAVSDRHFDGLGVFVRTRLRGHPVALPDEKPLRAQGFDRARNECLTFLRVRGGGAPPAPADRCPNCGAGIRITAATYCPSCQGILRRGEHDWVLAEIADRIDWVPSGQREVPGLDALVAQDPGFSRQHLEDRVAVIFWRLALADHLGSAEPLRRVADEGFCARFQADAEAGDADWAERSIGEVSTLAWLPGEDRERLLVEVRWLAVRLGPDVARPGRVLRERRPLRHLLVLGRRPGARTRLDFALASTHCPGCGAPEREGDLAGCPFCGAVPSEDWVLLERLARHEVAAERWLRAAQEAAPPPEDPAEAALEDPDTASAIAIWVASSTSGEGPGARGALIARLAARAGLPVELLEAVEDLDTSEARPGSSTEAGHWLRAVADVLLEGDDPPAARERLLAEVARRGARLGFYPARRTLRRRARRARAG